MNKKEAAEVLGGSVRLVERCAGEGRLGEVRYVRGRTGKQADFDPEAVEEVVAIRPATRAEASAGGKAAAHFLELMPLAVAGIDHEEAPAKKAVKKGGRK